MNADTTSDHTFDTYLERYFTFLEERNLRNTHERGVVVISVYEQDTHFTVMSLKKYIRHKKRYISRTSLYETLNLLTEAGLVVKHHFSDKVMPQYEKNDANSPHNHVYKEDTQTVIEFSDSRIDDVIKDIEKEYNVSVLRHSFTVYCNSKIVNS